MSIIQIFDQTSPFVSGYSMRSRYITDALFQLGVPLRVVSSPIFPYPTQEELIENVNYFRTKVAGWEFISKFPLFREVTIINNLKERIASILDDKVKLIDAHSSVLNGLAGLQVAQKYKVPFMYEVRALWEDAAVDQGKTKERSLRYNLTRKIETDVLQKADKVTVICEGLKKDILTRGINEDKIVVIPNGVDTANFKPMPKSEELMDKYGLKNCVVFGFIGTFFEFEGLPLLLKAAKKIIAKNKEARFLLVGGGREEESLKRLAQELDIESHVIFPGRIRHEEIQKYYSVIDILVYPRVSKRITELVTPLKPLESMALAKVVIGSDVGGIKELIQEGYNGFLFKAGDVDDLVDKCLYIMHNRSLAEKIGQQAREYVVRERNWLNICRRYLDVFKKMGVMP